MTLQLELNPEVEARLSGKAARRGMTLQDYVLKVVEQESQVQDYATGTGRMSREEFQELSRKLSEGSENLPILPPEVNDRASYYEDRW
jgi:macrodomain Ter protein organizer (MatP/YcbG family)